MRPALLTVLVLTLSLLSGCGSVYVNIPRQPSDVAGHNPNDGTVWRIEVAAMNHILHLRTEGGAYTLKLPEGTTQPNYDWVIARLTAGGNSWTQSGGFAPVYEIAAIYVRAAEGQVDVIRPAPGGNQLVSVFLTYGIDGWYVKRTRVWNIPVKEALKIAAPND
jgi:hypothetical protein